MIRIRLLFEKKGIYVLGIEYCSFSKNVVCTASVSDETGTIVTNGNGLEAVRDNATGVGGQEEQDGNNNEANDSNNNVGETPIVPVTTMATSSATQGNLKIHGIS